MVTGGQEYEAAFLAGDHLWCEGTDCSGGAIQIVVDDIGPVESSGQSTGNRRAVAPPRKSALSRPPISPMNSTLGVDAQAAQWDTKFGSHNSGSGKNVTNIRTMSIKAYMGMSSIITWPIVSLAIFDVT